MHSFELNISKVSTQRLKSCHTPIETLQALFNQIQITVEVRDQAVQFLKEQLMPLGKIQSSFPLDSLLTDGMLQVLLLLRLFLFISF